MANKSKYFRIKSFERLLPTGDASKILFIYSIADSVQDIQGAKDLSIVIRLSRTAENILIQKNAVLSNQQNQVKIIIEYLRNKIMKAIIKNLELPSEILISTYDEEISIDPDCQEVELGKWEEIITDRKMGFLPYQK